MIPVLIEAALRALVVALTVWAGLCLFRVGNVPAQKIAWGLVLACAAAMPLVMRWHLLPTSLTVRVPAISWGTTPESSPIAVAGQSSAPAAEFPDAQPKFSAPLRRERGAGDRFPAPTISTGKLASDSQVQHVEAQFQTAPELSISAAPQSRFRLPAPGMLATFLYLAVCAVLLIRMLYGLAMAARLWLASEPFEAGLGPNPENNPGAGLRLRFSFSVASPVTIGSGVILPADCLGWAAEKQRIVLAHERAHVRQGDFYLQLLACLYAAIFWFSPLGWWLKRKLSDLGEAISDRAGLEEAASRTSYAQLLLEFAALPRPTLIGVAMARSSNLSQRMERFLDESRFRQAFAASRRRMLLAVLLVPAALFAATALVRVEAAASGQAAPPPPAPASAPNPAAAPNPAPTPAAAPSAPAMSADQAPPAPADPAAPPMPPAPAAATIPPGAPADAPPPPAEIDLSADDQNSTVTTGHLILKTRTRTNTYTIATSGKGATISPSYSYSYSSDGDSWVLVTGPGDRVAFSGDWHNSTREDINKIRKLTQGKFLWFTHEGKSYFIDDPAIIGQVEAMYKPMEELGRQQEALGKKQEELGRQQEEMGRKQEQARVPTPDISKEMARLNEAVAKLDAKKGSTVSEEELAEIEEKIGDIQGRLGELQGEMGEKQGHLGEMQGKLGEEQGKLGEEQGRLGEQQGKLAEEADRKVKSIIDQSLHNGKARPVE
ncbi:MAG TPA: M56 family metallopeptidase [Terracidiphilus sp.]|nr:M56 family metallopeptidase [Terracidiphilus sp.]